MYHGQPELRVTDYKVYPQNASAINAVGLTEVVADPDKYTGVLVNGTGVVKEKGYQLSGLLQLQSGTAESADVKNELQESQTRINSMMMVHDKLYKSVSFKDISMKMYLEELAGSIHNTMVADASNIDVQVWSDDIKMNSDQVIITALLVNELLVNAFKHAFKGRKQGMIRIELREDNEIITLKVEDDGVGMPEDIQTNGVEIRWACF